MKGRKCKVCRRMAAPRGDRQASRLAQRAPKVALTTCKPSVRNLDDSCSSSERGTRFPLGKGDGQVSICPADVCTFLPGGGQCAGYGATPHKELAWLSLLKEVAPL